jgi:hypothetical protein
MSSDKINHLCGLSQLKSAGFCQITSTDDDQPDGDEEFS